MVETTQLDKVKHKRLKTVTSKSKTKERESNSSVSSYFYPKNNLYTRQEFELLDTIYSDDPPTMEQNTGTFNEDFWPTNKEEYLIVSNPKNNLLNNLAWFLGGVMLTSVIWLIYFQVSVNQIKTRMDTQIIFQNSAAITTDKNVDLQVAKQLESKNITTSNEMIELDKQIPQQPEVKKETQNSSFKFPNFFQSKPKQQTLQNQNIINKKTPQLKTETVQQAPANNVNLVKHHTVSDGDSLWTIANKYYSNPSPNNIEKIMKANKMRRVGILVVGQKIVIPE